MNEQNDLAKRSLDDLRFEALRNAIYHTARRSFLDRCNKLCNFIVIVAGTSAIAQLGSRFSLGDQNLVAIATIVATLQLVFDFGSKTRDHEFLQRRYYELLAKTEAALKASGIVGDASLAAVAPKISEWYAELYLLYAEEPPPLRALEIVAYNAACSSVGRDYGRVKLTFVQSLLRHIYPFNGTHFAPVKS